MNVFIIKRVIDGGGPVDRFILAVLLGFVAPNVILLLPGLLSRISQGESGGTELGGHALLGFCLSTLLCASPAGLLEAATAAGTRPDRPALWGAAAGLIPPALGFLFLGLGRPQPAAALGVPLALAVVLWPPALSGGIAAWIMTKERHGTA